MASNTVSARTARWCVELTFFDEFSQQGAHPAELEVLVAVADRLLTHVANTLDEESLDDSTSCVAKVSE